MRNKLTKRFFVALLLLLANNPAFSQAYDSPNQVTLTANRDSSCTLQVNADNGKVYHPASSTYPCGTSVELFAEPDACYQFVRWEEETTLGTDPTIEIIMDLDKTVTAVFEPIEPPTISPTLVELAIGNQEEVDLLVEGGIRPYKWTAECGKVLRWDGPDNTYQMLDTACKKDTITVKEHCGNTVQATVTIYDPPVLSSPPTLLESGQPIELTVKGGKPPYHGIVNKAGKISPITDEDGDGVFSLTYTAPDVSEKTIETLTVQDDLEQKSQTVAFTIKPVPPLKLSPQTVTLESGESKEFTIKGGKPSYEGNVNKDGTISPITDENGDGIWRLTYTAPYVVAKEEIETLIVQDELGQESSAEITIKPVPPPKLSPPTITLESGKSFDFTIQGGKPPYKVTVDKGGKVGPITEEDGGFTFTYTASYVVVAKEEIETLTVQDELDQENSATITIKQVQPLLLLPKNPTVKEGESLDFTIRNGKPPYSVVTVTDGQVGSITDINGDGIFELKYTAPSSVDEDKQVTLTVMDALAKTDSVKFSIKHNIPVCVTPKLVILPRGEQRDLNICDENIKPPYTWNALIGEVSPTTGEQITYTAPNIAGEKDIVTVTDSQGYTGTVQVTVEKTLRITPQSATQALGDTRAISFKALGGVESYQWVVSQGYVEAVGKKALYWPPSREGKYTLDLHDSKDSHVTATVQVVSVPVITPGRGLLFTNESMAFKVSGGYGPYKWSAQAGEVSPTEGSIVDYTAPNVKGLYTVTVTDGQNNQSQAVVQIVVAGGLMCSPPKSVAAVNEKVHLAVAHGVPPYTWPDNREGRTFEINFGEVGSHDVEARDARGNTCIATVNVVHGELSLTPTVAHLQRDEITTFSVAGGTPPYVWAAEVGSLFNQVGEQVSYVAPDRLGRYHLTVKDGRGVEGNAEVIVTASIFTLPGVPRDTAWGQIRSGIKVDGVARHEQCIVIDQDAQVDIKFPIKVPGDEGERSYNIYCAVQLGPKIFFRTTVPDNPFVDAENLAPGELPICSSVKSGESVADVYRGPLKGLLGELNLHIGYAPADENDLGSTLIWNQKPYTLKLIDVNTVENNKLFQCASH